MNVDFIISPTVTIILSVIDKSIYRNASYKPHVDRWLRGVPAPYDLAIFPMTLDQTHSLTHSFLRIPVQALNSDKKAIFIKPVLSILISYQASTAPKARNRPSKLLLSQTVVAPLRLLVTTNILVW